MFQAGFGYCLLGMPSGWLQLLFPKMNVFISLPEALVHSPIELDTY